MGNSQEQEKTKAKLRNPLFAKFLNDSSLIKKYKFCNTVYKKTKDYQTLPVIDMIFKKKRVLKQVTH